MKYKFIGTKQDMVDNGFMLDKHFSEKPIIFGVDEDGCEFGNELLIDMIDNEIIWNCSDEEKQIADYIQDLIEKGLVEELL